MHMDIERVYLHVLKPIMLKAEYVILTGLSEQPDLRKGILKKKHWVDFYPYMMDVYTHFQHTFMFKQLKK